ncbi:unnamed protein product [Rotaria socialis]
MLSATSKDQQHLFSSYRALGLVTNHVPCILRIHQRHSSHLLLTAIGKVFHAHRLNTLQILLVSDAHPEDIQVLASNSRLVFAAAGSTIYVYRRVFHLHQTLTDHKGDIKHLLPFGDEHLVSVDESNTLRVWDIQSGSVYLSLEFNTQNFHITSLLHPATYVNKLLVTSRQGTMQLWNIKANKLLHEFFTNDTKSNSITTIAQSTVVDVVAIGYNDGQIRLHNLRYDETLVTFTQDFNGPITSIAFRLDNIPHMATGSSTGHICIWNLDTCHLISQMRQAHKECAIASLHFIPGEPLLISNGSDNALREWIFDMPDGQSCRLYRERCGHSKSPRCVRFHDNDIILSAGNDGRLRTFHTILDNLSRCFGRTTRYKWELELNESEDDNNENESTEQPLPIVDLRCEVIKENDWDGIVAVHENRRRISAWNYIRATRSQHRFEHERFATKVYHNVDVVATCCDISPCGNFCVIGYSTGHIDMYNMQSGIYRGSFDDGPIKFAAKNPSKRLKSSPYATAHSFALCGISFDSLNTRLISCDSNGNIKLWRLKTKTLISSSSVFNQENSDEKITITKMIVHRDSGLIALAFNDYTIKIFDFDTMTCKCIRTFKTNSHKEEITALAFMPDARWLLSTSLDKTMRIWDIPSGQLIDTIEFDQAIITIAVSPNGDMLATGHTDALGVFLWSNRSMYDSSIIRTTNDVDNQELLVGDFQSPEQISKNLLTLSTLPESKWKNLLVLDTIRQRNKPKEAINIPKQAPFFLPTVSNLRGFVFINPDDEDEKNKKQSRIHQIQKFLHESSLTNFLDRQKASSSLSIDVINHLKDLGMAKIEYELRCLSPEQGGSLERMFKFIDILNQALEEKQNYDLVSSYLALFIQLHGTSFIWKNDELIEQIRKIQLKQKETWLNIQRQLNTSIALVKYIKSVTTI